MVLKGNPYENAYDESFIKTLKYEEANLLENRIVETGTDFLFYP